MTKKQISIVVKLEAFLEDVFIPYLKKLKTLNKKEQLAKKHITKLYQIERALEDFVKIHNKITKTNTIVHPTFAKEIIADTIYLRHLFKELDQHLEENQKTTQILEKMEKDLEHLSKVVLEEEKELKKK